MAAGWLPPPGSPRENWGEHVEESRNVGVTGLRRVAGQRWNKTPSPPLLPDYAAGGARAAGLKRRHMHKATDPARSALGRD